MGEQVKRSGPEPLKLGTQLVSQRRPCADEILPRPGQRPQRLGLIAIGLEHPEAVMVGARQLAEHERVKPIGLPARDPNRSRAAATWLGCNGRTRSPASNSRSTNNPSGRSRSQARTEALHKRGGFGLSPKRRSARAWAMRWGCC